MTPNLDTRRLQQLVSNWYATQLPVAAEITITISLTNDEVSVEASPLKTPRLLIKDVSMKKEMLLTELLSVESYKAAGIIQKNAKAPHLTLLDNLRWYGYGENREPSVPKREIMKVTVREFQRDFSEPMLLKTRGIGQRSIDQLKVVLRHFKFPPLRQK